MSAQYTEIQLDALRELANIGAGTASTALSEMLGRVIDLSVPKPAPSRWPMPSRSSAS